MGAKWISEIGCCTREGFGHSLLDEIYSKVALLQDLDEIYSKKGLLQDIVDTRGITLNEVYVFFKPDDQEPTTSRDLDSKQKVVKDKRLVLVASEGPMLFYERKNQKPQGRRTFGI